MKRKLLVGGMLLLVFACYSIYFRNEPTEYLKDIAPEITLKSPNGKQVNLSKLRGKLVLIDFWASWCGPCRNESPNVVEAYKKYKNRKFTNGNGFEVFSVSLDKDENAWRKAIKEDKLTWKNHGIDKHITIEKYLSRN